MLFAEHGRRIVVMRTGQAVEAVPTKNRFGTPRQTCIAHRMGNTPEARRSLAAVQSEPGSLPGLKRSDLRPCCLIYPKP